MRNPPMPTASLLASGVMSGSEPVAGWVPPDRYLPAAGWYRDPAGSGVLRWWDGQGWAAPLLWPPLPQVPAPPPGRLASWLASPAASPLLVAIAVAMAAGWAAAAAVMATIAASGTPIAAAAATLSVSEFVLPVADLVAGITSIAVRSGQPAAPARPASAARKAARRAVNGTRGKLAAVPAIRCWLHRLGSPVRLGSLPRPAGLAFMAAFWSSVLAFAWALPHGSAFGDAGATARGQQLAAAAWMMHLIAWCGLACRQLSRNRAAASMFPAVHTGTRT